MQVLHRIEQHIVVETRRRGGYLACRIHFQPLQQITRLHVRKFTLWPFFLDRRTVQRRRLFVHSLPTLIGWADTRCTEDLANLNANAQQHRAIPVIGSELGKISPDHHVIHVPLSLGPIS